MLANDIKPMNIAEATRRPSNQRAVPALARLPRPVYARVEDIQRRKVTRPHSHPWLQLSYASRGVLQIRTAQGLFVAPPQWAILIPPKLQHSVVNSPGTEMRSLYIDNAALPSQLIAEELDEAESTCQVLAVSALLRELIRHFSALPAEYDESGPEGRLVQVMLDLVAEAPREAFSLPWPQDTAFRKICTAILSSPRRPLRMPEWSENMNVSPRTLERIFSQQTGMTMRQWRVRARLLRALPLLERGDTVTDVALACGYSSTSAFIASFRQFFGATPGTFSAN